MLSEEVSLNMPCNFEGTKLGENMEFICAGSNEAVSMEMWCGYFANKIDFES